MIKANLESFVLLVIIEITSTIYHEELIPISVIEKCTHEWSIAVATVRSSVAEHP